MEELNLAGLAPAAANNLTLPLHLSPHSVNNWERCKRKSYWSMLRGLYPTGTSVHLLAGAAIAAGVEAARRYVFSHSNPAAVPEHEIIQAAYPAFIAEFGDYEPEETPRNAKTIPICFDVLANYLEDYHPGRDALQPLIRPDGSPAIEYNFAIPLPVLHPSGDPLLFVGRFDMLGYYQLGPTRYFVIDDEKTTSSFSPNWADSWSMHGQFIGYIWALRQQGFDIDSVLCRGIAIQKTKYEIRSALLTYPKHLIDRFETRLFTVAEEIITAYRKLQSGTGIDYTHPLVFSDACRDFGGCAYSTLCTALDAEDFTSNYRLHRYDPIKRQPIQEVKLS